VAENYNSTVDTVAWFDRFLSDPELAAAFVEPAPGAMLSISGTTALDGLPVSATVRLNDLDGNLLSEVVSTPTTGAFEFTNPPTAAMVGGVEYFVECVFGAGVRPLMHGPVAPALIAAPDDPIFSAIMLDAPLAYYRMNESVGAAALADSSGNGHSAALSGTVAFGEDSMVTSPSFNKAMGFLASNASAAIPDAAVPDLAAPWAVEFWAKWTTGSTGQEFVTLRKGANYASVNLSYENFSKVGAALGQDTNLGDWAYAAGTNLNDGQRHHIVARWTGTQMTLLIDGQVPTWSTGGQVYIGPASKVADGYYGGCSCVIDELAIYDYAPTVARFQAHHAAGANP
jgi:hypothetical protein